MNKENILAAVDHTLLHPESTWAQIKELCDDAMKYHTASVCIPPSFVKRAKEYVLSLIHICPIRRRRLCATSIRRQTAPASLA